MDQIENMLDNESEDEDEKKQKALEKFKKAGKIAAKIRKKIPKILNPGETILDVAETIEKMIQEEGATAAFPVNISIDSLAAHYTPAYKEEVQIGEKDLIKVDFGVSIDGCIADNAISVDLSNENQKLLEASESALKAAIENIKEGIGNGEIGKIIEQKIKEYGYKPIENLTGHKIEPYNLHAGVDIPNVEKTNDYFLKEGDVIALEPFATTGEGRVVETPKVEIYSLISDAKLRLRMSRELINKIASKYFTLPFAKRWIFEEEQSYIKTAAALNELIENGCLHPYPILKEAKNGLVSQFEHTIIVQKDGAEIIDGDLE
jgi:methionyl aminopeptidase